MKIVHTPALDAAAAAALRTHAESMRAESERLRRQAARLRARSEAILLARARRREEISRRRGA